MPPLAVLWDVFCVDGLHPCYLACLHLCMASRSFVVISGLVAATHESPEGLCQFALGLHTSSDDSPFFLYSPHPTGSWWLISRKRSRMKTMWRKTNSCSLHMMSMCRGAGVMEICAGVTEKPESRAPIQPSMPLSIYLSECKFTYYRDAHTPMFITPLFLTAREWSQPVLHTQNRFCNSYKGNWSHDSFLESQNVN